MKVLIVLCGYVVLNINFKYAAASAVLAFSGGSSRSIGLTEKLGTSAFDAAVMSFQKKDKRRIRKAEKAQDEKEKN